MTLGQDSVVRWRGRLYIVAALEERCGRETAHLVALDGGWFACEVRGIPLADVEPCWAPPVFTGALARHLEQRYHDVRWASFAATRAAVEAELLADPDFWRGVEVAEDPEAEEEALLRSSGSVVDNWSIT